MIPQKVIEKSLKDIDKLRDTLGLISVEGVKLASVDVGVSFMDLYKDNEECVGSIFIHNGIKVLAEKYALEINEKPLTTNPETMCGYFLLNGFCVFEFRVKEEESYS